MLRFSAPEVLLGLAIVVSVALAATVTTRSPLFVGLAVVVGTILHLSAVDSGNHSVGWLATGMVLALGLAALGGLFGELPPVANTVPALVALVHNELIGLGHARRRSGMLDRSVPVASLLGLSAVAVVSVVGIGLAQRLDGDVDRSWLWMAMAAGVVTAAAVLLTWLPARRPNPIKQGRWSPGERLPPPSIGGSEIGDPPQLGQDPLDGSLV